MAMLNNQRVPLSFWPDPVRAVKSVFHANGYPELGDRPPIFFTAQMLVTYHHRALRYIHKYKALYKNKMIYKYKHQKRGANLAIYKL
jgi:hypothetical protein